MFDSAPNALNLVRLVLALEVLLWHSYSLRGGHLPDRLSRFASDVGVDGFFAVSGLLIARAWLRDPRPGRFLLARVLRILPGLWVSLLVTVALVVPAATALAGRTVPSWHDRWAWAWGNAHLSQAWTIGHSLDGRPNIAWNGSLWTLEWEAYCYALVLALGLLGLLRRHVVLPLLVAVWSVALALDLLGAGHLDPVLYKDYLWMPQRGFLMFLCGSALWLFRDRVRLDGRLALAAAAALPVGVLLLDDYRVVAAPALTYLLVYAALRIGGRGPFRRTDLSYGVYVYAYPLQQAMLLLGAGGLGLLGFAGLSALAAGAAAWLSWHAVEHPAQRLRRLLVRDVTGTVTTGPVPTGSAPLWRPSSRGPARG